MYVCVLSLSAADDRATPCFLCVVSSRASRVFVASCAFVRRVLLLRRVLLGASNAVVGSAPLLFSFFPQGAYGKRDRFYKGFDFDAANNATGEDGKP